MRSLKISYLNKIKNIKPIIGQNLTQICVGDMEKNACNTKPEFLQEISIFLVILTCQDASKELFIGFVWTNQVIFNPSFSNQHDETYFNVVEKLLFILEISLTIRNFTSQNPFPFHCDFPYGLKVIEVRFLSNDKIVI